MAASAAANCSAVAPGRSISAEAGAWTSSHEEIRLQAEPTCATASVIDPMPSRRGIPAPAPRDGHGAGRADRRIPAGRGARRAGRRNADHSWPLLRAGPFGRDLPRAHKALAKLAERKQRHGRQCPTALRPGARRVPGRASAAAASPPLSPCTPGTLGTPAPLRTCHDAEATTSSHSRRRCPRGRRRTRRPAPQPENGEVSELCICRSGSFGLPHPYPLPFIRLCRTRSRSRHRRQSVPAPVPMPVRLRTV